MIHVSRAEWGARSPQCSILPLNRSRVSLFIVHYSGASRTQSVRSIQNFCMDNKGHCDIDYNRIVRGEYDYMGRGWGTGGHTLNHNSISYGVCMIGVDGDATDDDKRTIRGIYDQVCAELGRQLTMTTHRNVLGASYTSCPGNELDAWVDSGMPMPAGSGGSGFTMFCRRNDNNDAVMAMQLQIKQVRPDLLPVHGADGDYGQETADAVSIALTGGPGDVYGPEEYAILQQQVAQRFGGGGQPGPAGPPGPPGKTPTQVTFGPVTATVTAAE